MGETITRTAEHTDTEQTGNRGNTSSTTTSTERAGGRASTGTGTTAGTKTEEVKSESLFGLSDLEKEQLLQDKKDNGTISDSEKLELRRLVKNRTKREKYQQAKEEREKAGIVQGEPIRITPPTNEPDPLENVPSTKPKSTKSKNTRTRAKAQKVTFEAEQLDTILVAIFDLVASRPNMGAWKITKAEAHTISVPLCEVLAKYDQLNTFTQNSSEIALIVACISLFVPRLIATVKVKKEVSQDGLYGKSIAGSTGRKLDKSRPSKTNSTKHREPVTTASQNDVFINDAFGQPL